MEKVQKILIMSYIFFLLMACRGEPKVLPTKEMIGVNGRTVYTFEGKKKIMVYKPEYFGGEVNIVLNTDSLELGNYVEASIFSKSPRLKLILQEPIVDTIASERFEVNYKWQPSKSGLCAFSGIVETDSINFAFRYKIVVK